MWSDIKEDFESAPLWVGGIPKHVLNKKMKSALEAKHLIHSTGDQPDDFSIRSMGACFERININWDDKNKKNENLFIGALDGKEFTEITKFSAKRTFIW